MTAPWLARIAREAGGLSLMPSPSIRIWGLQVAGRALAGRLLHGVFGRAKDAQGFDWAALAHGPGWLLGRGKKTGGSQGTRSGKAQRRLPLTPNAFLPDWKG